MNKEEVEEARTHCRSCDVRVECLLYALLNNERWGVWGGLTHPERQRAMSQLGSVRKVATAAKRGRLLKLVMLP